MANLSSGVDVVHATRQVCCPAEKTAGKKTTRLKKICVTVEVFRPPNVKLMSGGLTHYYYYRIYSPKTTCGESKTCIMLV